MELQLEESVDAVTPEQSAVHHQCKRLQQSNKVIQRLHLVECTDKTHHDEARRLGAT
jgi:hypothetical protein